MVSLNLLSYNFRLYIVVYSYYLQMNNNNLMFSLKDLFAYMKNSPIYYVNF